MMPQERPPFCAWCGERVDDANYCTNCGRRLANHSASDSVQSRTKSSAMPSRYVMAGLGALMIVTLAFIVLVWLPQPLSDAERAWCRGNMGAVIQTGRALGALPEDGLFSEYSDAELQAAADAGLDGALMVIASDWDDFERICKVAHGNR